ncbi:Phage regulatory protein Rha [compost metagenome]
MNSVEIAELTGKRPADVKRDIRNMLEAMGSTTEQFCSHMQVPMQRGGYRKLEVYALPRRELDILLTGYSVTLRAKVIDRWRELEAEVAKPATVTLSDASTLRSLLLGYTEQLMQLEHKAGIQAEKIAEDEPKVDYYA